MTLQQFFEENHKVALAFSGGVDSAYLLYAAKACGADIRVYYVRTPFQPRFEYADALQLAGQLEIPVITLEVDVLSEAIVAENPKNRCYHCKKRMFTAILQAATAEGFPLVIDGTNASDRVSDRPGMEALRELGIRSPLRECGLRKEEIRRLSKEAGLFTCDKPAYACLATRIPAGTPITRQQLARTERGEAFLRELGFSDFRIRLVGDAAKLQLTQAQLPLLLRHREQIVSVLKKDYSEVLLDLEVRNA